MPKAKNKTTKVRVEFPFSDLPFVKDTWENGEQTRCWWAVEDEFHFTPGNDITWKRGMAYAIMFAKHIEANKKHSEMGLSKIGWIIRDMQESKGVCTGNAFLAALTMFAGFAVTGSIVNPQSISKSLEFLKPQDSYSEHRAAA